MKRIGLVILTTVSLCARAQAQSEEAPAKWLEEFEKKYPPREKNAAAEELVTLARALGVAPLRVEETEEVERTAKEASDLYQRAGFGSWLDAELKKSTDVIDVPPQRIQDFLERQQATLSRVVALLVRETPEWGFDAREARKTNWSSTVAIGVNRILLSAALAAERGGRHLDAAEYLEASWPLTQSFAARPDLLSSLLEIALEKLQVGVLRKMAEPSFQWPERLSSDALEQQVLGAFANDHVLVEISAGEPPSDDFPIWVRAWRAVADNLRGVSPCQASNLTAEEIVRPVIEEWKKWSDVKPAEFQEAQVISGIMGPNHANALRRAARLAVDRELTRKILELRQEKAAARSRVWPSKLLETESRVCPGAFYEYQTRGATMTLRFKGSIEDPGAPLVLPLSFEARAPSPTATPTRTPRPTRVPAKTPLTPLGPGA